MKGSSARCLAFSAVLGACLLAGCDTASDIADTVRTKLAPPQRPRTRVYAATQRAAYEAALATAKDMGYTFIRGGPAEGILEELSPIDSADTLHGSRQIALHARFEEADGGVQVSVGFGEILATDTERQPNFATETPLRDTPLYEVFLRGVQQGLATPPKP